MIKKAIAGVLSAVMCASALLSDAPLGSRMTQQAGEQIPAAEQQDPADGLQGSNSFARYLQQQTEAQNTKPAGKNMQAAAAETTYSVTNLEFDAETGTVRVVSSQSYAQKLVVSFIDEDNPANVYRLEADVEAGAYISTELQADLSKLPAFFTVSAQLVNRLDQPVCDAFTLNWYIREMQQILAKSTTDFAPELVVNFDGDESTNFAVLSDETVRADSDADINVLVSADYGNNIYTFDNIDENIRTLESGNFFFSMPSQNDLIAIQVTDVTIEGDTATVSGSDSLDGMFDFIKIEEEDTCPLLIETTNDGTTEAAASCDEDAAEEQTSEKQFLANAAGQDEALEFINQDAKAHEFSYNFVPTMNLTGDNGIITAESKLHGTITWKFNFYIDYLSSYNPKDWYACAYFVVTYDFEASFKAKAKDVSIDVGTERPPFDQNNYPMDGFSVTAGATFTIPTDITGLVIHVYPRVSVYATLDFEAGYKKLITRGFYCDTRSGLTLIRHESEDNGVKLALNGEIHVLYELSVSLDYMGIISAYVTVRLELNPQCKIDQVKKESPLKGGHPKSGHIVFACPGASGATQHVCDYCLSGILYATISGRVGVDIHAPLLTYQDGADFGPVTTRLGSFYCSAIKTGLLYKLDRGMGACPHYANKTTVIVTFKGEVSDTTAILKMDNDSYSVGPGKKVFYTVPGKTVNYELTVNNPNATITYPNSKQSYKVPEGNTLSLEIVVYIPPVTTPTTSPPPPPTTRPTTATDPITTTSTTKTNTEPTATTTTVTFTFTWQYRTTTSTSKSGTTTTTAKPVSGSTRTSPTPVSTTTTTVTEVTDVVIPTGNLIIESVQLGPYIYANLYNNGVVYAWGCGDMYETFPRCPFKNVTKIKYICLIDKPMEDVVLSDKPESEMTEAEKTLQAALKDGVINSIGKNVFSSATALTGVELISWKEDETYQPSRITIISEKAFSGCSALKYIWDRSVSSEPKTVDFPQNLVTVGEEAFLGCKLAKFGDLVMPDSVTDIGERAFKNCEGIKTLDIKGSGETVLGRDAFAECSNMTKAVIGDGVTGLNARIFNLCESLADVTIPFFGPNISATGDENTTPYLHTLFGSAGVSKSDTMYGVSAYNSLIPKVLSKVTVTGGTSVPAEYFRDIKTGKHIILPDTVTDIGARAFYMCTDLESVNIPHALVSVSEYAFYGCSNVQFGDLVFPDGINTIGEFAFCGCSGITSVFVKGNGETVLARDAFASCDKMTKAVIGDGVTGLNARIFNLCESLSEIVIPFCGPTVDSENPKIRGLFGEAANNHDNTMYKPTGSTWIPKALNTVIITDTAVIPQDYFDGIISLESITLPSKLETVEEHAFGDCVNLKEAYLIGDDADWDNVEIQNTNDSNKPLVDLVRKNKKGCPLMILADPANQTVHPGETARFAVYAAGKNTLTYLWQSSGNGGNTWENAGSTTDTLTFTAADVHNGRLYRCVVTDEKGNKAESAAALLTVAEKTADPADPGTSEKPAGYLPGDVNGDGKIDVSDAVLVARYANEDKDAKITDLGRLNGDVNGDGQTDMMDVADIVMFIARLITKFAVDS